MTDKEWKELCDWAKQQKYEVKEFDINDGYNIEEEHLLVEDNYINFRELTFEKDGTIFMNYYQDVICENRTYEQIKAIITNLL